MILWILTADIIKLYPKVVIKFVLHKARFLFFCKNSELKICFLINLFRVINNKEDKRSISAISVNKH